MPLCSYKWQSIDGDGPLRCNRFDLICLFVRTRDFCFKMNLIPLAVLFLLVVSVSCETTQAPNQALDDPLRANQDKSENVLQNEVEQPVQQETKKTIISKNEVITHPDSNPNQLPANSNFPHMIPAGPNSAQPPVGPFQRQTPPFFGHPFRPSLIRSQPSTFVALPPRDQPAFDLALCQQESNSKRDLEKRSLNFRHLETFYMNSKNQDIIFSLCGDLTPAHLVVIESISPKLEAAISALKNINNAPIVINDISDLLNLSKRTELENSTVLPSVEPTTASGCTDDRFKQAFKIFLKFFYIGGQAFNDIQSLEVGFLVWRLGVTFLDIELVHNQIEPKISNLIQLDNHSQVYRFARDNKIASLDKRWSDFINANSRELVKTDRLPISCEDIQGDIVYLDRFIEALNVNQSITIGYIRQYLRTCPESSSFVVTGNNQFPRSLIYFRCSVDDLKELVKMGFMNYETLAQELENRLRAKEHHCEEKCSAKFAPMMNPNFRHVLALNPGASNSVGRRA